MKHLLLTTYRPSETDINRSDEGLTLKTLAFKLFTVANLRYQLSW